jgi:hypothetical protein
MSPLDVQRIVDGELDHAAQAEILQSLGEDAREWRSLALALLEEQQWSRELQRDPFPAKVEDELKATEQAFRVAPQTLLSAPVSVVTPSGRKDSFGSPWFTALAASILLCVGLASGMLLRSFREGSTSTQTVAQGSDDRQLGSTNQNIRARSEQNRKLPMKMVLTGTGGSEGRPLEIPVVDASEIDPRTLWARDAQELSKLQLKLEREGYRMEWEPRLYSGRLNDGRQIVVPVHNVALKSVGL